MVQFTDTGINLLTKIQLGIITAPTYGLHLYTNNYKPTLASITAFFNECQLSGYDPIAMDAVAWSGSEATGMATYQYPTQGWFFEPYDGGTSLFGYFITEETNGTTVWAEAFSSPFVVSPEGAHVSLTLYFNGSMCLS